MEKPSHEKSAQSLQAQRHANSQFREQSLDQKLEESKMAAKEHIRAGQQDRAAKALSRDAPPFNNRIGVLGDCKSAPNVSKASIQSGGMGKVISPELAKFRSAASALAGGVNKSQPPIMQLPIPQGPIPRQQQQLPVQPIHPLNQFGKRPGEYIHREGRRLYHGDLKPREAYNPAIPEYTNRVGSGHKEPDWGGFKSHPKRRDAKYGLVNGVRVKSVRPPSPKWSFEEFYQVTGVYDNCAPREKDMVRNTESDLMVQLPNGSYICRPPPPTGNFIGRPNQKQTVLNPTVAGLDEYRSSGLSSNILHNPVVRPSLNNFNRPQSRMANNFNASSTKTGNQVNIPGFGGPVSKMPANLPVRLGRSVSPRKRILPSSHRRIVPAPQEVEALQKSLLNASGAPIYTQQNPDPESLRKILIQQKQQKEHEQAMIKQKEQEELLRNQDEVLRKIMINFETAEAEKMKL
ncbi:hypothetical protein EDC01DRAFT_728614 [Geopyxis carbonaria]|nr:hypothetical protein EDC01DRAFT_728614 [Geopyxis carbonaria]